jgi:hypothetical protein
MKFILKLEVGLDGKSHQFDPKYSIEKLYKQQMKEIRLKREHTKTIERKIYLDVQHQISNNLKEKAQIATEIEKLTKYEIKLKIGIEKLRNKPFPQPLIEARSAHHTYQLNNAMDLIVFGGIGNNSVERNREEEDDNKKWRFQEDSPLVINDYVCSAITMND